jgi:biopolymer transport protein TolQ
MKFNYISLFFEAGLFVQIILVILFFSSIYSWSVIFEKIFSISSQKKKMMNFEKFYINGRSSEEILLRNLFSQGEEFDQLITYQSFKKAKEFVLENQKNFTSDEIEQIMIQNFNFRMNKIQNKLDNLGTIASIGPYVSLLGTMFGIIRVFSAIGASKSVNLVQIGPGIAEVLFTTAVGLIVSIPAAIFYNKFISQINYVESFSYNFFYDISSLIHSKLSNK